MKQEISRYYRVECNFGSKYFHDRDKAFAYYNRKAVKNLDVELWLMAYCRCTKKFHAEQQLIAYSGTQFLKN